MSARLWDFRPYAEAVDCSTLWATAPTRGAVPERVGTTVADPGPCRVLRDDDRPDPLPLEEAA